jgi:hypothetical protein
VGPRKQVPDGVILSREERRKEALLNLLAGPAWHFAGSPVGVTVRKERIGEDELGGRPNGGLAEWP